MMFTERSKSISEEVKGLTPQQSKMYLLAWKHNTDCYGYMGLCTLWQLEISMNIRLKDVEIVIDRLKDYGFFNTDAYYKFVVSDYPINDFIPGIYMMKNWRVSTNDVK